MIGGDDGSFAIAIISTQDPKTPITASSNRDSLCTQFSSPMSKTDQAAQREQRLAAKLRENLKRRKGQAKARSDSERQAPDPQTTPETVPVKKP
ncbi:hypothetical protein [Devosia epidermidihirudinis]|uniref:hypothetical protein n=1 Tax=Devosia epidermidihirudinis TaxID=1293439 RepID=UPI0012E3BB8B|nr:hypothetical protein [Devosia epidermidihirudinis]